MAKTESRSLAVLSKEILLYIPAIGGPAIVGVLSLIVLTRLLSPTAYGEYAVALSVATMAAAVLGDWLTPTLIRFHGSYKDETREAFLRPYLVLAAGSSLVAAAVVIGSLGFIFSVALTASAVALATALIHQKVGLAVLRAKLRTGAYSAISIGAALCSFGLGIAWYLATERIDVLLWGTSIVLILTLLPIARLAGLSGTDIGGSLDRPHLRSLMSFGVPIIITAVGAQALLLADRYLLTTISGTEAVGLYVPNYAIAERAVSFAFAPLFNAVYPLAARAWAQENRVEAVNLLTISHRLFLVVGGYVVILLILFGDELSALMLGSDFVEGGAIVGIVALGNLVWFEGILFHQPLELDKRTRVVTIQALAAGALNIGLNIILIPPYGLMGAAWATMISYVGYAATAFVWSKRAVGIQARFPLATLWRLTAFGVLAWIALGLLDPSGTDQIWFLLASTILYVLWLLATKEPVITELRTLMGASSR